MLDFSFKIYVTCMEGLKFTLVIIYILVNKLVLINNIWFDNFNWIKKIYISKKENGKKNKKKKIMQLARRT